MAEAYGTPQYGGENFGGWGSLEGYSMKPQPYVDQVKSNGVLAMDGADPTKNSFWNNQKQWVGAQAGLAKNQMVLFYQNEMLSLQNDLQVTSQKLTNCDWNCVNECSKLLADVVSKAGCLDTCKCYEQAAAAPVSLAALSSEELEAKIDQIDA